MVRLLTEQTMSTTTTTTGNSLQLQRPKCIENMIQNSRFRRSSSSSSAVENKQGEIKAIISIWMDSLFPSITTHLGLSFTSLDTIIDDPYHLFLPYRDLNTTCVRLSLSIDPQSSWLLSIRGL